MTNNIRKYLEYGLFIILNIGMIAPVYSKLYLLAAFIAYNISLNIFKISEDIIFNDDPTFFIFFYCFGMVLTIFKPIILQIIYIFFEKLHYINKFLNKLRNDKNFLKIILLISFLIDALLTFILKNIFILFFGLLFSYLIFLLFFPFNKNINDKKSKIIITIFIIIIIFILLCPIFLFLIFNLLDIIGKGLGLI